MSGMWIGGGKLLETRDDKNVTTAGTDHRLGRLKVLQVIVNLLMLIEINVCIQGKSMSTGINNHALTQSCMLFKQTTNHHTNLFTLICWLFEDGNDVKIPNLIPCKH